MTSLIEQQADRPESFPLERFDEWFDDRVRRHRFRIDPIPFDELRQWEFAPTTGNLVHASGKFFSIEGLSVETNWGSIRQWNQPIINQPEIGYLGMLAKPIGGVLHFLMQAKMEPGNIRCIQLAPTLQATKSNYTRVHHGKTPLYLDLFRNRRRDQVLVDSLQSEQGSRFLRKRNRNMVILLDEQQDVPPHPDFLWLTLRQIRELLRRDNVINMDARTVLACLPESATGNRSSADGLSYPATADPAAGGSAHAGGCDEVDPGDLAKILAWVTELKCDFELRAERIPLRRAEPWEITKDRIAHPSGDHFEVIAVRVEADNREVTSWTQPILKPCHEGLVAFVTRERHGRTELLVQAKVEAGNFDVIELAPTIQCLSADYRSAEVSRRYPFADYVLAARPEQKLHDTRQSEEGGRFFREENRNMVVRADADFPHDLPRHFSWVPYHLLKSLLMHSNIVNVQARCLLNAVPSNADPLNADPMSAGPACGAGSGVAR